MNRGKEQKKVIAFILTLALVFTGAFPVGLAYGAERDIAGHWAEGAIQSALAAGYVSGYPDGSFQPNQPVTRAEFVTMVNQALGLREENKVNLLFEDVAEGAWYYDEVQKASYAQYISGVSESEFQPEALITRQEAAAMLSRFLPSTGETSQTILSTFSDAGIISSWAKESLSFVIEKGYINGYQDQTLNPLGSLTRAEAVQIISQILKNETIIREDTSVKEAGAILSNAIYVGDITIESSVGSGDVDFANLSALSKVYVYGGGSNTVSIKGSLIIELIVGKVGSAVRVLARDDSMIKRSLVLGNNLLVNEEGKSAEPRTGSYGEILTIQGTTSQQTFLQIAQSIGRTIDNSGKVSFETVLTIVNTVVKGISGVSNEDGSISFSIPRKVSSSTTSVTDPNAVSTIYGTVMLSETSDAPFTKIATLPDGTTTAYAIYTAEQLQHMALHLDANGILMNDLDFTYITPGAVDGTPMGSLSAAAVNSPYEWYEGEDLEYNSYITACTEGNFVPIGIFYEYEKYDEDEDEDVDVKAEIPYTGTFFGNSKTITGLTISGSGIEYVGIFGFTSGATIKDFTTSGGSVTVNIDENDKSVGGVVGGNKNSTISAVCNTGTVSAGYHVGGIVGYNHGGTVIDSHNAGSVTGVEDVGGVVGYNDIGSSISTSYNTGNITGTKYIVGGVVG